MNAAIARAASPLRHQRDLRGPDRRRAVGILNRYTLLGGRRVEARRGHEQPGYVADQHGVLLFVAVLAIALFNILDAFFTMLFLSYGGIEMNPFVDWVLQTGGLWSFLAVKSVGIGLCVAFLTLTKNFRTSRVGLWLVLIGYSALLSWHFYLLGHLPA